MEQLAALNNEGLIPYADILPLQGYTAMELRWMAWGKTSWRFFRAWCAARLSMGFPWSVWGVRIATIPRVIPRCPLCGVVDADLQHLLAGCSATAALRRELNAPGGQCFFWWVPQDESDAQVLRGKVRFVGLCLAAALRGLRRSTTHIL